MPYIKEPNRENYDKEIDALIEKFKETARYETTAAFPGDLNYTVTRIVVGAYIAAAKLDGFKLGYSDIAEMKNVLREAADELGRRLLAEYEERAKQKNGDVKEYKEIKNFLK